MPHLVKENINVNQMHWQGFKKNTIVQLFQVSQIFPPQLLKLHTAKR